MFAPLEIHGPASANLPPLFVAGTIDEEVAAAVASKQIRGFGAASTVGLSLKGDS